MPIQKEIHATLTAFEITFVEVNAAKLSVLLAVTVAEKELFILIDDQINIIRRQ